MQEKNLKKVKLTHMFGIMKFLILNQEQVYITREEIFKEVKLVLCNILKFVILNQETGLYC